VITVSLVAGEAPTRIAWHVRTDHDRDHLIAFDTVSGAPPAPPDRADVGALLAVFRAMNFRQALHVDGPVSWSLLARLEEWMDAWARWRPDLYEVVPVTAAEVIDDRADGAGALAGTAVVAFSGGVDATYATAAHATASVGRRSQHIAAAVLIQGFDIPLDDADGFDAALHGATAITDELGVDLVAVRTNWRDVCLDWEMEFGVALAAVLHHFSDRATMALVADDNPYDAFHVPWGTNPVSQHWLASNRFAMAGVGGGLGRADKCRFIGRWASVREHVRVCWEGPTPGRNCQRCEKCIRTNLAFIAAGIGEISSLGVVDPSTIGSLQVRSAAAVALWDDLLGYLDQFDEPLRAAVVDMVRRAHDRFPDLARPAVLDA